MRVILKKDVYNLGRAGDIKEVKDGYARNFLFPRDLVMSATARTVKEKQFLDNVQKRKVIKRKKTAEETAKSLAGKEVRIVVKTGEEGKIFGSVNNIQIQKELEKMGFQVERRTVALDDPIKTLGVYNVQIKFYDGIQAQIKVIVQDEQGNTKYVAPEAEKKEAAPAAEAAAE